MVSTIFGRPLKILDPPPPRPGPPLKLTRGHVCEYSGESPPAFLSSWRCSFVVKHEKTVYTAFNNYEFLAFKKYMSAVFFNWLNDHAQK
jgi:hypothetical protein